MAVLVALVRRTGETVSREDLLLAGWGEREVGDESLTETISRLRRAFGDSARVSRYIQTVPKKGYRLIAIVKAFDGVTLPVTATPMIIPEMAAPKGEPDAHLTAPARFRPYRPADLFLVAAASAVFAVFSVKTLERIGQEPIQIAREGGVAGGRFDPNPGWLDIDPNF